MSTKTTRTATAPTETNPGTLKPYVAGFVLSITLTLIAFALVELHALPHQFLVTVLITLALGQFLVQLLCFLHLGHETKPHWRLAVFLFMLLVVGILVGGSLWIMSNLSYRMTSSPTQIDNYMNSQDGL